MDPNVIVIDGKTYHHVNEMPAEIRQKYEQAMRSLGHANDNQIPDTFETMNILGDKDRDGVPDVFESITSGQASMSSMKIVIDGKEFSSIENLPPEARARYEEAMGKLDANRNGIPDFVEGMMSTSNQTAASSANFTVERPQRSTPFDIAPSARTSQDGPLPVSSPTITPDTSNGWMLVLAGLFFFMLCVAGAAGVWYFFLR